MIKKKIKVVISDLDGTLLNTHHKISDYTKRVFQKLHEENYLIIVATGRHHLDAHPIVAELECPVYLVTSNGARIHNPNNELLFSRDIESDAIKSVLNLKIDPEITTVLFKENVWQTNKNNEKLNSFQTKLNYLPELVDFNTLDDLSGIKLFFTHESHSKLIDLRDTILENHSEIFSHAFSLPICLEFMDKSVDKSVAIAKILEIENFVFEESISFGDGYNDEKMLKSTGKGLVMGNAPDSLKNKLSHLEVISSNDYDGVAKYLSKTVLNLKIAQ
ncbi:Cof subfamily protein (haloacid dehalogenase superfamily) [Flavobacterium sp. CG_9.10]|uniref:Cof-type HAD-IIB family hydrolase n=1 Tax=Flavobacterium sp. CG_9.10 TaxID=2787729 RepID=UPI0018CB73D3|nr:Cof-type HAD-IIB family hydrolase [Flavobacterium sp. CG_9.10]MBG6111700.1 Cof subfamily protein (haloacid dehalogenase superfamily) [Flavobacterium sp. CG_9.10]